MNEVKELITLKTPTIQHFIGFSFHNFYDICPLCNRRLNKSRICMECKKSMDNMKTICDYQFDVEFEDDTCKSEFFVINPKNKGINERIMNERALSWREKVENLSESNFIKEVGAKIGSNYQLKVKVYSHFNKSHSCHPFYEIQNIYPID